MVHFIPTSWFISCSLARSSSCRTSNSSGWAVLVGTFLTAAFSAFFTSDSSHLGRAIADSDREVRRRRAAQAAEERLGEARPSQSLTEGLMGSDAAASTSGKPALEMPHLPCRCLIMHPIFIFSAFPPPFSSLRLHCFFWALTQDAGAVRGRKSVRERSDRARLFSSARFLLPCLPFHKCASHQYAYSCDAMTSLLQGSHSLVGSSQFLGSSFFV